MTTDRTGRPQGYSSGADYWARSSASNLDVDISTLQSSGRIIYTDMAVIQNELTHINEKVNEIKGILGPLGNKVYELYTRAEEFVKKSDLTEALADRPTRKQFRSDVAWIVGLIAAVASLVVIGTNLVVRDTSAVSPPPAVSQSQPTPHQSLSDDSSDVQIPVDNGTNASPKRGDKPQQSPASGASDTTPQN